MKDQLTKSTLQTKYDFEHLSGMCNVKVQSYHADNGRFAERSFLNDVKGCLQHTTFCGVGAHHQNEISKKCN